ncbi:restriction endonuclease subunit S [Chryseobacterium nepalense]|uniref:restriction endonuclease subunit S n=1 Tax=Chryseobacterium nepalense TaxID=1854498 RepID=UPI002DF851B0|nr:type I restriction enzyme S subunit [Chryseobacterium nepalense]
MSYKSERIGNAVRILSGYAFDSTLFNREKKGFPIIRVRDVNSGFTGLYYAGEYNPAYIINKGDLLVSLDGNFKCVVWQGEKALLNQRVCKLIPDENKLHKNFLLHILPQKLERIHENTDYTTVKHLSINIIRSIKIPLPPISDQIKIANVLEKAYTLKSTREENLDLLNMFLKSSFLKMFGTPQKNKNSWKKESGNTYCHSITVGVVVRPASYYVNDGVIALRTLNIKPNKIILDNIVFFSEENNQNKLSKSILKEGDVVFVRTGSTGTAAVIPKELNGSNCIDLIIARPNTSIINPHYLAFFFNSEIGKKIVSSQEVGGIHKHFNVKAIKSIDIPIPPIDLQNKFGKIVEKSGILIQKLEKNLIDINNLIGGLTQKAFNGDLDLDGIDVLVEEYYSSTDNDRTEPSHFEKPINWESVEVKPKKQQEVKIKVQDLELTKKDFDVILDAFLYEKKNRFQFNEFADLLIDKDITFDYEDIRDFIFQKLEQKKLVQYYSSDYWMNNNYKPETSPLQDDFSGTDGNIWLTTNTIDK